MVTTVRRYFVRMFQSRKTLIQAPVVRLAETFLRAYDHRLSGEDRRRQKSVDPELPASNRRLLCKVGNFRPYDAGSRFRLSQWAFGCQP